MLLNCLEPGSASSKALAEKLSEKYGTAVMPVNCLELEEEDITKILTEVLYAFPVKEINISMPSWINTLEKGHWLKEAVFGHIREAAAKVARRKHRYVRVYREMRDFVH